MTDVLITPTRLRQFAPQCDANAIAPLLQAAALSFGIDTPREVRHWMATLYCESAAFTRVVELMGYSASRMMEVWPSRFPTLASAKPYAHNGRALANKVYGGRLGNTGPDDGWLYRGSGPIQVTGKANFKRASEWCGVDFVAKPDLLRTWEYGSVAAAGFWKANGLNGIVAADPGEKLFNSIEAAVRANEEDDLRQARKVVNGGLIGLDHVREALVRAAPIFV